MTQKEILEIALAQSASDSNCAPKDFLSEKNKIVFSEKRAEARRYLELPFLCDFVSYGHNVVASVSPQYYGVAAEYISRFPPEHCFETPALHVLDELLNPLRARVCFMAEYWLPDLSHLKPLSCPYPTGRFLRTLSARMEQRALRKTKGAGYSGNRSLRRGKIDRARGRLRRLPKYVADRNRRPARIPQPRRRFRFDERFGRRNTPSE